MPHMTLDEIAKANGKDGSPLYFGLNGKVIQYTDDLEGPFGKIWMGSKAKGLNSFEVVMAGVMYDPKFGVVTKPEQVTRMFACVWEDQMCEW